MKTCKMFAAAFGAAALVATPIGSQLSAEEQRSVAAHEHGTTNIQIALENGMVSMALQAPGADIVGFEHPAESAGDQAAVKRALDDLSRPLELFVPPAKAECRTRSVSVLQTGEDAHEDHEAHEEHAHEDHADDHDAHEEHEAHDDHGSHEHGEAHEEHAGHDDHDGHEEEHLEFRAEYTLACADMDAFEGLDLTFFERFDGAAKIHFEILTEKGAGSFTAIRGKPYLALETGS